MNVLRQSALVSSVGLVLLASCSGYDGTPPATVQPRNAYPPQQPPPPGYYYPPPPAPTYPQQPGYVYPPPQQQPVPQPPPSADRFASARQQCVTITNGYRARLGLPPLGRRPDMEGCADAESASDGRSGKAHGAFGLCKGSSAQNECPGWDAASPDQSLASCLQMMFNEGPGEPYSAHGHYINMTGKGITGVACGFSIDAQGQLWVVQDFF